MARIKRMSWEKVAVALGVMSFALVWTGRANAQTSVRIACSPLSTQTCTATSGNGASTTVLSSSGGTPTFEFTTTNGASDNGDTMYLAILVPSTTNQNLSFTVTGNGMSGTAMDISGVFSSGTLIPNSGSSSAGGFLDLTNISAGAQGPFGPLANVSSLGSGSTPTGFNVYVFDLGTYDCPAGGGCAVTFSISGIASLPPGTIFWGYMVNSSGQVVDSSPNTELVTLGTVTITPEPATLGLLGTGLLLIGGILRRRLT